MSGVLSYFYTNSLQGEEHFPSIPFGFTIPLLNNYYYLHIPSPPRYLPTSSVKCPYHSPFYALGHIQGDSRLVDITAGGDFLGLCDQKSSYKHVSDFGRLRSYDRLKLGIEGNDY